MMLLTRIDDVEQSTGSKYLNTVQNRIVLFSFEQRTMNKSKRINEK
jgi:hypothetical protein